MNVFFDGLRFNCIVISFGDSGVVIVFRRFKLKSKFVLSWRVLVGFWGI